MHYLDEGAPDADPVLMVHGNPTWSFYWRNLILPLREELRTIAVDHVGCGLSNKPASYAYNLTQTYRQSDSTYRIAQPAKYYSGGTRLGWSDRTACRPCAS